MRYNKLDKIIEVLRHKGFDMTTKQFFDTTVYRLLKRYGICEHLDLDEYFEMIRRLMDICAENDLKDMGMDYLNENDFQFK